jgi:hypothetical protein
MSFFSILRNKICLKSETYFLSTYLNSGSQHIHASYVRKIDFHYDDDDNNVSLVPPHQAPTSPLALLCRIPFFRAIYAENMQSILRAVTVLFPKRTCIGTNTCKVPLLGQERRECGKYRKN